jgi:hypothetical protein
MTPTVLWLVTADNHDYDVMSQWVVGAFTSKARAKTAIKNDEKGYERWMKGSPFARIQPNYKITKVSLNVPEEWGK